MISATAIYGRWKAHYAEKVGDTQQFVWGLFFFFRIRGIFSEYLSSWIVFILVIFPLLVVLASLPNKSLYFSSDSFEVCISHCRLVLFLQRLIHLVGWCYQLGYVTTLFPSLLWFFQFDSLKTVCSLLLTLCFYHLYVCIHFFTEHWPSG